MKRVVISAIAIGTAVLFTSCATKNRAQTANAEVQGQDYSQNYYPDIATGAAPAPDADDPAPATGVWPMTFNAGGTAYTVYEPQCDSWDGHEFVGRSAVAVQAAGQAEPTYGVVAFNAITLVDKSSRTVTLANFQATSANFPSAPAQAQNYLGPITQNFPKHAATLALDRLENSLNMAGSPKADRLDNSPPKIIVATRPSILVYVDGPPALRPVAGTDLQRVINTRMLLLKDGSGKYYLHLFDGHLQAASLQGPWTVASQPPAGAATAEQLATASGQVDLMPGTPDAVTQKIPTLATSPVPDVFAATRPTELIQLHGAAEYASIQGTDLLYVDNTSGNVFRSLGDQQYYILISGRWYRADSLAGPWLFVPGSDLPHDFANIPDSSPKENVKASVPGTPQAEEALIANSIPQSTAVPRGSQMTAPQFDGAMQLAPIPGTPLQYVANSPTPVIEVNSQSWYACQDGVWYDSSSANGPWMVAASVPPVIYSIPPDSPLHYLTYVQVYGASPDSVYEGYTPGYMGTEVADDGTVVYGTGYDYDPWIGSAWYGPPITWGWGFDCCWTPWWGWGFGPGFGWGWGFGWAGCFPPFPWWGGFHHGWDHGGWWHDGHGDWHGHGDWANTSADVYHHDSRFAAGGAGSFARHSDPGGLGHSYNSRTGWLQGGQHSRVLNVPGAAWSGSHGPSVAQNRASTFNGFNGSFNNRGTYNHSFFGATPRS